MNEKSYLTSVFQ